MFIKVRDKIINTDSVCLVKYQASDKANEADLHVIFSRERSNVEYKTHFQGKDAETLWKALSALAQDVYAETDPKP